MTLKSMINMDGQDMQDKSKSVIDGWRLKWLRTEWTTGHPLLRFLLASRCVELVDERTRAG